MSSFHKNNINRINIEGTKLKNNLLLISSGIPSLDHVIGGGLPAGAVFVVEEDILGNYSRVLTKYFLAEGIICKHHLFIASADEDPKDIVKELPQPCMAPPEEEINNTSQDLNKMKIAWRYEGLAQVESSFGTNSTYGHHFDLSKHIEMETIKNNKIDYCDFKSLDKYSEGFKNRLYYELLSRIKNIITSYKQSNKPDNFLRISIQSLGSPLWMAIDCEEDSHASYGHDLVKFMYCLRLLLRDTNAAVFVTMPSHLFDDDHIMKRLLYSIDNAVRLESFTGSSKEANPAYKDYHGLFHITKLSALYTLAPFVPSSIDLSFKLKRKKFVIEKLHLPPELQESSEREQDDIISSPFACGGFKKKDIEF